MIIPIRCFGCNKPIAHLWEKFKEKYNEDLQTNNIIDLIEEELTNNLNGLSSTTEKIFLAELVDPVLHSNSGVGLRKRGGGKPNETHPSVRG